MIEFPIVVTSIADLLAMSFLVVLFSYLGLTLMWAITSGLYNDIKRLIKKCKRIKRRP